MLDTNTVSYIIKNKSPLARQTLKEQANSTAISVVTEAELLYGLAKRPQATKLNAAVHAFLTKIRVLSWDSACAASYGRLRASLDGNGFTLSANDLLIAAQALAHAECLVTADKAFGYAAAVSRLKTKNWANDVVQTLPGRRSFVPTLISKSDKP